MREYEIKISVKAIKSLDKIPEKDRTKILDKIDLLKNYPHLQGLDILKLKGFENTFRMRVGNYRVIYIVYELYISIEIEEVGHRKDVYK